MDYQFYIDPISETPVAELNVEHELLGRWLTEEVGRDAVVLVQILRHLENTHAAPSRDLLFPGKEVSLSLNGHEAAFEQNGVDGVDLSEQLDPHVSEQADAVVCGTDDLAHLLRAWQTFVTG